MASVTQEFTLMASLNGDTVRSFCARTPIYVQTGEPEESEEHLCHIATGASVAPWKRALKFLPAAPPGAGGW
jgi:hypothetical protein